MRHYYKRVMFMYTYLKPYEESGNMDIILLIICTQRCEEARHS